MQAVNIELTESEIKDLLSALQMEIQRYVQILQENDNQPESEIFVIFVEGLKNDTDLYVKLHALIKEQE